MLYSTYLIICYFLFILAGSKDAKDIFATLKDNAEDFSQSTDVLKHQVLPCYHKSCTVWCSNTCDVTTCQLLTALYAGPLLGYVLACLIAAYVRSSEVNFG